MQRLLSAVLVASSISTALCASARAVAARKLLAASDGFVEDKPFDVDGFWGLREAVQCDPTSAIGCGPGW